MGIFLVTGGSGFIGSNLVNRLLSDGHWVYYTGSIKGENSVKANFIGKNFHDIDFSKLPHLDTLFHQAATTDTLIHDRKKMFLVNVEYSLALFERAILHGCKNIVYASCYDNDTEILSERGFIPFSELKLTDLIASMTSPGVLEFVKPKKIISQQHNGEMYHVKSRSIDLLITPNHRMVKLTKNGKIKYPEVSTLKTSTPYHFPLARYVGKLDEEMIIDGKSYKTTDIFYLLGLYAGDGYGKENISIRPTKTALKRHEYLKASKNSINGRFQEITNTIVSSCECHSYRVSLAIPKKDKARHSAVACLKRLGLKINEQHEIVISFSSKTFLYLLKQCGDSALTKHLPPWVFNYDAKFLDYLYRGLVDSDGYYRKNGNGEGFCTSSKMLSDDFAKNMRYDWTLFNYDY